MVLEVIMAKIVMGHKSFIFANITLFLFGILSCDLYQKFTQGEITERKFVIDTIYWSLLFAFYKMLRYNALYLLPFLIWNLSLFTLVCKSNFLGKVFFLRVLCNNLSLKFGRISYSAYCIHLIPLYFIGYLLVNSFNIQSKLLYSIIMLIVPLFFTIYLSNLMYKYIELPSINFGKRYKK